MWELLIFIVAETENRNDKEVAVDIDVNEAHGTINNSNNSN